MSHKLELQVDHWYGWQMLPGYDDGYLPYYSPIHIQKITPQKTGKGLLGIDFFNAMYAEGVQGFSIIAKVIDHQEDYLIVALGEETIHRNAILSTVSFRWIEENLPRLWYHRPPSYFESFVQQDCQYYLNAMYFGNPRP